MIQVSRLSHTFSKGKTSLAVLKELSFTIRAGEMVAIQGPSGSGKSTLLYILGCLLKPQFGDVSIASVNVKSLSDRDRARLRHDKIGFVFQQFHLLQKASALENILLPMEYSDKVDVNGYRERVAYLADQLHIKDRIHHNPNELSGGQQQRVAIARALMNDPPIILADEPTGNLDSTTAQDILQLLRKLNKAGKTIVIITHDNEVAQKCDRIITVRDGRIVDEGEGLVHSPEVDATANSRAVTFSAHGRPKLKLPLKQSIANLLRNRTRAILTMVGISVGTAAIFSMVTLGQYTQERILAGYMELGANSFGFWGSRNWEQKATDKISAIFQSFSWKKDVEPLNKIFPQISAVSPVLDLWGSKFFYGGRVIEDRALLMGINELGLAISGRKLIMGRNFSRLDVEQQNRVCIIGFEVAQRLFMNSPILGRILRFKMRESESGCKVIGVLVSQQGRNEWSQPNLNVFLPFTTFQSLADYWHDKQINGLIFASSDPQSIEKLGLGIRSLFERKYGASGKFRVDGNSQLVNQMKRFLALFTILLTAIAGVTLFVGGIGIMNMMLVAVSERIREIGLRKALGANDALIRLQFLAEGFLTCVAAGIFGLILGFVAYEGAIYMATKFSDKLKFAWIFNPFAFALAAFSIFVVGILASLYPAVKAQKFDVVEALRSE